MTPLFAVLAPHFPPASAGGGPIRSLDAQTANIPDGTRVLVLTRDRDAGSATRLDVPSGGWTRHGDVPVFFADTTSVPALLRAFAAVRARRPDYVCLNTFFGVALSLAPRLLGRVGWWRGARIVIAPRGEFGSWALGSKAVKKKAYIAAFRLLGLHRGVIWHAAMPEEADDIRAVWGPTARVVVDTPRSPLPATARRTPPAPAPALRAVSYGRLTHLKGLDLVLRGLAGLPAGTRLHLDVVGPPEDAAFVAECRRLAAGLPEGITVAFTGLLDHHDVQTALSRYDVAFMGTLGESFGHALAEVLSVGCPLLVADTTPWTSAIAGGAGLVVPDVTADAWAATIARFVALDEDARLALREGAADAFERAQNDAAPHLFDRVLAADRHR